MHTNGHDRRRTSTEAEIATDPRQQRNRHTHTQMRIALDLLLVAEMLWRTHIIAFLCLNTITEKAVASYSVDAADLE